MFNSTNLTCVDVCCTQTNTCMKPAQALLATELNSHGCYRLTDQVQFTFNVSKSASENTSDVGNSTASRRKLAQDQLGGHEMVSNSEQCGQDKGCEVHRRQLIVSRANGDSGPGGTSNMEWGGYDIEQAAEDGIQGMDITKQMQRARYIGTGNNRVVGGVLLHTTRR